MRRSIRRAVRERAQGRCEYCLRTEDDTLYTLELEHIIARKHQGSDDLENLALCCTHCNLHKGPNIAGIDPETGDLTELFHPRRHRWEEHFGFDGWIIVGRTPIGRTTVQVLCLNSPAQIYIREERKSDEPSS
jgi:hypothetical protein